MAGEEVYVPSQRTTRLNIFSMIDLRNNYDGFMSTESITVAKVAEFLDRLSFKPRTRDIFVVLDNASVHRYRMIKDLRPVWEKRGLFLFFFPPYSLHLNLVETL